MIAFMATVKHTTPRPDKYSKKRSGSISQSLRVTVEQNKRYREASSIKGQSLNTWMVRWLDAAALHDISNHLTESENTLGKVSSIATRENNKQSTADTQADGPAR